MKKNRKRKSRRRGRGKNKKKGLAQRRSDDRAALEPHSEPKKVAETPVDDKEISTVWWKKAVATAGLGALAMIAVNNLPIFIGQFSDKSITRFYLIERSGLMSSKLSDQYFSADDLLAEQVDLLGSEQHQEAIAFGLREFGGQSDIYSACDPKNTRKLVNPRRGSLQAFQKATRTLLESSATNNRANLEAALDATLIDIGSYKKQDSTHRELILVASGKNYCSSNASDRALTDYSQRFDKMLDVDVYPSVLVFEPTDKALCDKLKSTYDTPCWTVESPDDLASAIRAIDGDYSESLTEYNFLNEDEFAFNTMTELSHSMNIYSLNGKRTELFHLIFSELETNKHPEIQWRPKILEIRGAEIRYLIDTKAQEYIFETQNINQLGFDVYAEIFLSIKLKAYSYGSKLVDLGSGEDAIRRIGLEVGDQLIYLNGIPLSKHVTMTQLLSLYYGNFTELVFADRVHGLNYKRFHVY